MNFEKLEIKNVQGVEQKTKSVGKFSFSFPKLRFKFTKKTGVILSLLILVLTLGVLVGIPARQIYKDANIARDHLQITYGDIKKQDLVRAKKSLEDSNKKLIALSGSVNKLNWFGSIPVVGAYQKDLKSVVNAGIAGVEAGQIAVQAIEPYADLLGLEEGTSFVNKSTEDRLQTAITTIDKLSPSLEKIAVKLKVVRDEIETIDPDRYPEKVKDQEVRSKIVNAKNQIDELADLFIDARPFLTALPSLFGVEDEKTYLFLFQNDKELRPTGGFITAYAYFRMHKGKIEVIRSDDIYNLDNARRKKVPAPEEILKYHKNVYELTLRDSNLSPDFKVSMLQFEELYDDVSGKLDIDGIFALDTQMLVEAMKILGPINAYGTTFTTEPDKRCGGCPQVVYELEDYADARVGYVRNNRKDIIGVLMSQIMQKALGVSPGQYWGKLFQMTLNEVGEKHFIAYFHDKDAQDGAEALNFAGRIKKFNGDYLHINDTNFAGAKSNMFTNHNVDQEIDIAKDGTVTKTLTLNYKNTAPGSPGCNLERGGLCLNGLLRNWLRVYVPEGSELMDFKGSEMDPVEKNELGKTVFEGFFTVRPEGQAQIKISYKLPFKVDSKEYKMLIQKQPGTEGHEYTVNINGKRVDEFELLTDKELKLNY